MRCLTTSECKNWFSSTGWPVDPSRPNEEIYGITANIPENCSRSFWFSNLLSKSSTDFETCLLRVTTWGVWHSSENLHLFYKLREAYGERRLLHEAPGLLFLKHEQTDLTTFIQVALLSGWDFHLYPSPGRVRVFVSHDGWFELFSTEEKNLDDVKNTAESGKIAFKPFRTPIGEYKIH